MGHRHLASLTVGRRTSGWSALRRVFLGVFVGGGTLFQGCALNVGAVDPDLGLRATITFFSELAVFALENAARGW